MAVQFNKRKETTQLIIHCSATKPTMDVGVREIRQWHRQQGWLDVGYNLIVRRDGTVEKGRDLYQVGAHTKGHNSNSVSICLIGGVDSNMKPEDNFTEAQYVTLDKLVDQMVETFSDLKRIIGHRDIDSGKACPSFDVKARYGHIKF